MDPFSALPDDKGNFEKNRTFWYQAKEYDFFWNTYSHLMLYTNEAFQKSFPPTASGAFSWHKISKSLQTSKFPLPSINRKRIKNHKKSKKKQKKKRKKLKEEKSNASCSSSSNIFILSDDDTLQVKLKEQMVLDDTTSEVEDEFLDFLKQSVTHRIKWNMTKELKRQQEKKDEFACDDHCVVQENPDVLRENELKRLYGDEAAKIHGMETAMQLSFDRFSTLHQPAVWPNIPLNFTF